MRSGSERRKVGGQANVQPDKGPVASFLVGVVRLPASREEEKEPSNNIIVQDTLALANDRSRP